MSLPNRRNFLSRLLSGFALGSLGRWRNTAPASAATDGLRGPSDWDLTWIDKLTAKHRVVFDSPDINEGTVFINAFVYLAGYHEAYGASDADLQSVLVLRGNGFHMALNNAMWEKYRIAEHLRMSGPTNPFLGQMAALRQRGAILLACNVAATYYAEESSKRTGIAASTILSDFKANLGPGVILQPSGVFATVRAQEAGCSFMKSA